MISVIVPAYNAEKTIEECLKSLTNQNYPKNKYEVIIVDDGSKDNTKNIVKKFKNVKLLTQKHKGPAAARNLGAKKARGEIILFTDSDCVAPKNWIKYMVEPFKDKDIVGVSGTYRTWNKESLIARFSGYEIEFRHEKMKNQSTIDFIGTFSAGYRRDVFMKFGGFDENFPIASGEDVELSFKLSKSGLKMVFQPKAYVYHNHPDTLTKYLKQKYWRGYWRVLLYKTHKQKLMRHSYTPKTIYMEIAFTWFNLFLLPLFLFNVIDGTIFLFSLIILFFTTFPLSTKIAKKDFAVGLISPFILILRNFFIGLGIIFGIPLIFKK